MTLQRSLIRSLLGIQPTFGAADAPFEALHIATQENGTFSGEDDRATTVQLQRGGHNIVYRTRPSMEETLFSLAFWCRANLPESDIRLAVAALGRLRPGLLDSLHAIALGSAADLMRVSAEAEARRLGWHDNLRAAQQKVDARLKPAPLPEYRGDSPPRYSGPVGPPYTEPPFPQERRL